MFLDLRNWKLGEEVESREDIMVKAEVEEEAIIVTLRLVTRGILEDEEERAQVEADLGWIGC